MGTNEFLQSTPEYQQTIQEMNMEGTTNSVQNGQQQYSTSSINIELTNLILLSSIIQTICIIIIAYHIYQG